MPIRFVDLPDDDTDDPADMGDALPPDRIQSLTDVAEDDRGFYTPDPGRGFVLIPELRRARATVAEPPPEIAERLAALREEHDKLSAALGDTLMRRELREALEATDVRPQFRAAVIALLKSRLDFTATERPDGEYDVTVITPHGPAPVADVVRDFAESEDGKPYLAPRPAEPGAFTLQMRELTKH